MKRFLVAVIPVCRAWSRFLLAFAACIVSMTIDTEVIMRHPEHGLRYYLFLLGMSGILAGATMARAIQVLDFPHASLWRNIERRMLKTLREQNLDGTIPVGIQINVMLKRTEGLGMGLREEAEPVAISLPIEKVNLN